MKRGFRRALEGYNEIATEFEQAKRNGESLNLTEITAVLDFRIRKESERSRTPKDAQEAIFALQRYKQEIMTDLHDQLKAIDRKEQREVGEGQRFVRMEDGELLWDQGEGHDPIYMTVGELLTDGEWGLEYVLDVESVPRKIQKQYAVEEAKRGIRALLDEQIVLEETASDPIDESHERIQLGYDAMISQDAKNYSGKIAEKGLVNFLKKLRIDKGMLADVFEVDAYQDMEHKIDFVFKTEHHSRGVDPEIDEKEVRIGFQFTIAVEKRDHKEKQIAEVKERYSDQMDLDDILLVAVPMRKVKQQYLEWERAGKPPGGPDSYWDEESKKLLLEHVAVNVLEDAELSQLLISVATESQKRIVPGSEQHVSELRAEKKKQNAEMIKKLQGIVRGSKYFRPSPLLLLSLAHLSVDVGVDLGVAFQDAINDLRDDELRRMKPVRYLYLLNGVLRDFGAPTFEDRSDQEVPEYLSGLYEIVRRSHLSFETQLGESLFQSTGISRKRKKTPTTS